MSNGMVATPMTPTNTTPIKTQSSPGTPLSSVRRKKESLMQIIYNICFFQPSLRRKLFRSSPMSSPNKERYGDRFIPVRNGNNWETNFSNIPVSFTTYWEWKARQMIFLLKPRKHLSNAEFDVEQIKRKTERSRFPRIQRLTCDISFTGKILTKCEKRQRIQHNQRCQWRHKRP